MPHGAPTNPHRTLSPLAVGIRQHAVHVPPLQAAAPAALDFLAHGHFSLSAMGAPPAAPPHTDPVLEARWPQMWLLDPSQDPVQACHGARLAGAACLVLTTPDPVSPPPSPSSSPPHPRALPPTWPMLDLAGVRAWQAEWASPVLVDVRVLDADAFGPDAAARAQGWAETALLAGTRLALDLHALLVQSLRQVEERARARGQPVWAPDLMHEAEQLALDVLWSLPPGSVGLLMLAGFQWPPEEAPLPRLARNHRVAPQGWTLFEAALAHLGPLPTLLLWDTDLPPLAVLLDEVRLARQIAQPFAPIAGGGAPLTDPWA